MVGIGNNITAIDDTIDCCVGNLIDTSVLEVHLQGITVSDLAVCWFFLKNAALYGAGVGNGRYKRAIFNRAIRFIGYDMEKFAAGDGTMIYEGRERRMKITATDFSVIYHIVGEIPPNNGCVFSNREFALGDISSAGNN